MVGLKTIVMKKNITIVLLLISNTFLFGQVQKTYVKSFVEEAPTVSLNLSGKVEVVEWEEGFVRVHANVSLEGGSLEVLRSLVLAGRYGVEVAKDGAGLVLTSACRDKEITYRGRLLEEEVVYTVFVPRYIEVKIINAGESLATVENLSD